MHAHDFCYWLQGLFELANPTELDSKQTESIKAHLNMVFVHEIDTKYGSKEHLEVLNKLHPTPLHGDPKARC